MERRCGPPPDRYRLGCAAPRGPKGVLYLCRPMASNSTLQRPTAQRRRRRRRNPQVCGGERGQPNWITGALGPGRRGVHARGSAEPALPCSSPNRLQAKYDVVSQTHHEAISFALKRDAEAVEADRAHVAGRGPWPSRAPAAPSPGAPAPPAPTLGAASSVSTAFGVRARPWAGTCSERQPRRTRSARAAPAARSRSPRGRRTLRGR